MFLLSFASHPKYFHMWFFHFSCRQLLVEPLQHELLVQCSQFSVARLSDISTFPRDQKSNLVTNLLTFSDFSESHWWLLVWCFGNNTVLVSILLCWVPGRPGSFSLFFLSTDLVAKNRFLWQKYFSNNPSLTGRGYYTLCWSHKTDSLLPLPSLFLYLYPSPASASASLPHTSDTHFSSASLPTKLPEWRLTLQCLTADDLKQHRGSPSLAPLIN